MYGLLEILIMVYAGSTYKHFVSLMSIHYNHAGGTEEESIRVEWNDHASEFNASWLRGEDIAQLPTVLTGQIHGQSWDAPSGYTNPNSFKSVAKSLTRSCGFWLGIETSAQRRVGPSSILLSS